MTHKEVKVSRLITDDTDLSGSNGEQTLKRPRTQEDFYQFCSIILEYANYERLRQEEETRPTTRTPPPLDSSGSSINSESATSSGQEDKQSEDESDIEGLVDSSQDGDTNDDSYDSVTCYCHKPFAGRPMIECSRCLTWVHLSCARIRRTHIPDVFFCAVCKSEKHSKLRGSSRNSDQITRSPGSRSSPPGSPKIKRIRKGH